MAVATSANTSLQQLPPELAADAHLAWLQVQKNQAAFERSALLLPEVPCPWGLSGLNLPQLLAVRSKAVAIQEFLALDAQSGGFAAALWPDIIHAAYPDIPVASPGDLKGMLVHLIARRERAQQFCQSSGQPLCDFVEGFAGQAMVTLHLLMEGFHGKRLDLEYGSGHDIILNFRSWMDALTLSAPGALHWAAPKCSSFVILCRGPSGRRSENQWWGDESKAWVRQGNEIMVRCALWLYTSWLLDCKFICEQPANSILFKMPPMSTVLAASQAQATTTWHSAFGAPSPKPFRLFSNINKPALEAALKRKKQRVEGGIKLVNKKGTKFSGNKNLTKSQAYTPQFGAAVAALWALHGPGGRGTRQPA